MLGVWYARMVCQPRWSIVAMIDVGCVWYIRCVVYGKGVFMGVT